MFKYFMKTTAIALSFIMLLGSADLQVQASGVSSVLPKGGISMALTPGVTLETIHEENNRSVAKLENLVELQEVQAKNQEESQKKEESFEDTVIAKVNDYINIRSVPDKSGKVVGKLYNKGAGIILSKQDDWYEIQSGNVKGFVNAQFCVTGEEAAQLAKEVGTRMALVESDRLLVRQEANADAVVLGMVAMGEELAVTEETEDWIKVDIEEGFGWVSREYVKVYTEFTYAESREEEAARLAKEAKKRNKVKVEEAQALVNAITVTNDNAIGVAVAEFAVQFVGNPYVWGGSSLTNGADCSGFVMKVYEQFGVALPHSSSADRKQGYAVSGLENAQPGDLICYSGHVAIYIGNGQIVHASNAKDGIKISNADYRKILAIRRIF